MNLKFLVKLSNIVALISILLLIYWVFVFVSVEVFGFRIFRENISQTFAMSVLGILALMGGSLMINVMFNLTRIAQKHNQDLVAESRGSSKKWIWLFGLTFPLVFGLLFAGDYATSKKKESMLIQSAKSILESNADRTNRLANYQFGSRWLIESSDTLDFFERTERNFPHVSVIVKDEVEGSPVFLAFRDFSEAKNEKGEVVEPSKRRFLMATSQPDRDYLNMVFDAGLNDTRFTASDGNYELFYPYVKDGKRIVLYFSDYQRYGKMGS
jgi:hypothetical protein